MSLPKPYYEHNGIAIFHADCRDILPQLEPGSVDLVLTDPPYGETTHQGARTGRGDIKLVNFNAITVETLTQLLEQLAITCRAWFVATMEWRHIAYLEQNPPIDWRFVRFGIWVKPNGMPQYSGDRPATGWEGIVFLHKLGGRMYWNGRGRSSVFIENKVNTEHPTGKPLPLFSELTSLFSNPTDLILDPFMGSGTTLIAAQSLGRKSIGIEIEEKYCEIAVNRLQQLPLLLPEIAAKRMAQGVLL